MAEPLIITPNTMSDPTGCLPGTRQEMANFVSEAISVYFAGNSFSFFNYGQATPAPEDQNRPWFRLDSTGYALGWYSFFNGKWVRQAPYPIDFIGYYQGPASYFDGTGKGIAATQAEGWCLCLSGDSLVELESGGLMTIQEMVESKFSGKVKAYNFETDKWEYRNVVNWSKQEFVEDEFVRLTTFGGIEPKTITLTKNHPVFSENRGWVEVAHLQKDEMILTHEHQLTEAGKQMIMGTFLGDGYIDRETMVYKTSHGEKQKAYSEFIANALSVNVMKGQQGSGGYGEGLPYYRVSKALMTIFPEVERRIPEDPRRKVTRDILNSLGAVGLAFWYMDDGNITQSSRDTDYFRSVLNIQGFKDDEQEEIVKYLKEVWGISSTLYKVHYGRLRTLRMDEEGTRRFNAIISPFILPELRYKLIPEYRNHPCILNDIPMMTTGLRARRSRVRPLLELSKTSRYRMDRSGKYDIEVEGLHNFVANDILVHNCNGNNGTRDLRDQFIVTAKQFKDGRWRSDIDPSNSDRTQGGDAQYTLTLNNLPPFSRTLPTGSGEGSSQRFQFGTNTNTGNYDLTIVAEGSNRPVPFDILPPFFVCAAIQWRPLN